MLFVLTGDVQTGKTRWLTALVETMQRAGVGVYGVIAPGVWADRRHDAERLERAGGSGDEGTGVGERGHANGSGHADASEDVPANWSGLAGVSRNTDGIGHADGSEHADVSGGAPASWSGHAGGIERGHVEGGGPVDGGGSVGGVESGRADNYDHVDENGFEKLGIDNVLLPSGERIPFARRADLAIREHRFNPQAQSARAGLGWHIDEEALRRVDAHFAAMLPREAADVASEAPAAHDEGPAMHGETPRPHGAQAPRPHGEAPAMHGAQAPRPHGEAPHPQTAGRPAVLVVDELGRLELENGQGLVHALALLEAGPGCGFQHALVVVREGLLPQLEGRFPLWGPATLVSPDDESADTIMETVLRDPFPLG